MHVQFVMLLRLEKEIKFLFPFNSQAEKLKQDCLFTYPAMTNDSTDREHTAVRTGSVNNDKTHAGFISNTTHQSPQAIWAIPHWAFAYVQN